MKYKELKQLAKDDGIKFAYIDYSSQDDVYRALTIAYRPMSKYEDCKFVEIATAYCSVEDEQSKRAGKIEAVTKFWNANTVKLPIGQIWAGCETEDEFKDYLLDKFLI